MTNVIQMTFFLLSTKKAHCVFTVRLPDKTGYLMPISVGLSRSDRRL